MKLSAYLAAAICANCLATAVHADSYRAVSRTAESITGDISMDDYEIVFANGERLALSDLVSYEITVGGETRDASVYRVEAPADPVLLNGNRLCGSGEVTFVANWAGSDDRTVVAVFATSDVPQSDAEMCASYVFE